MARKNDRRETAAQSASEVLRREVLPIVEERVRFDRREVAGRSVSVTTRPVTETVTIAEPVTKEDVTVERVPIGRVVEQAPAIREEGDLTIVPVVEERVTVTVELVLKEEIHLRRTRREETVEREVELRRTEVDIEGS